MVTCRTNNRNGTRIKLPEVRGALNELLFMQDNLDGYWNRVKAKRYFFCTGDPNNAELERRCVGGPGTV